MTVEIKYAEPKIKRLPEVMTRSEAARYLRVDARTFDRYCQEYNIPRFQATRRIYVRRADVDALFKTSSVAE